MERSGLTDPPSGGVDDHRRLAPRWLRVSLRVPSEALEAPELIQRLKHAKKQVAYEDFVVARKGEPEIGEQEFLRLLERLPPHSHHRREWILFSPSWIDPDGRHYQKLWEEGDNVRLLREDGVLGQCSRTDFSILFRPFDPEESGRNLTR